MSIGRQVVCIIVGMLCVMLLIAFGFHSGKQVGMRVAGQQSASEVARLNKAIDFFVPPLPVEIFSISGEVKSIESNIIALEIMSLAKRHLPGTEPTMETRRVTVTDKTALVQMGMFAPPKFDEKTKLPLPPEKTPIQLSDIKVGDTVMVTAAKNIKMKQQFDAMEIILYAPSLSTPRP